MGGVCLMCHGWCVSNVPWVVSVLSAYWTTMEQLLVVSFKGEGVGLVFLGSS